MEVLVSDIRIGEYKFDYVHEVSISSTWQEQTVKGTITLPAKIRLKYDELKKAIKKGDRVTIDLGYNGELNRVFSGFVARVKPTVPVVIEVEDEMWKLKQILVNDKAKNETVKSFLERNIPYPIDAFDIQLPSFVANKITAAQLLDQFKQDYGFPSFFRNGKLVIGKQYDPDNYSVHIVKLNYNVVEDSLEYSEKDDVKIKVTAISNMSSGEKIEVELGDADGESRTLNFYNLPKSELEKVATQEIDRLKYNGYRGDITIFFDPFVRTGDVIELRNDEESDKTGRYWVDGVNYTFGVNGGRQQIKLGPAT